MSAPELMEAPLMVLCIVAALGVALVLWSLWDDR